MASSRRELLTIALLAADSPSSSRFAQERFRGPLRSPSAADSIVIAILHRQHPSASLGAPNGTGRTSVSRSSLVVYRCHALVGRVNEDRASKAQLHRSRGCNADGALTGRPDAIEPRASLGSSCKQCDAIASNGAQAPIREMSHCQLYEAM